MSRVLWLVVSGLLIAVVAGGSSQTVEPEGVDKVTVIGANQVGK